VDPCIASQFSHSSAFNVVESIPEDILYTNHVHGTPWRRPLLGQIGKHLLNFHLPIFLRMFGDCRCRTSSLSRILAVSLQSRRVAATRSHAASMVCQCTATSAQLRPCTSYKHEPMQDMWQPHTLREKVKRSLRQFCSRPHPNRQCTKKISSIPAGKKVPSPPRMREGARLIRKCTSSQGCTAGR
jgi:hypothetical protein